MGKYCSEETWSPVISSGGPGRVRSSQKKLQLRCETYYVLEQIALNALIEAERIINLSNGRIDGTKKYRGTCRVQVLNLVEVSGGCTMMSTLSTLRDVHYCTFYIVLEHYSGFNAPKVYTVSCSIVTSGSCFARLFITFYVCH